MFTTCRKLNREVIDMKNKFYNSPLFEITLMEKDIIMVSQFSDDSFDYSNLDDPSVKDFY